MLFTPDGLEQATRLEVAAQHANRFRTAGIHTVYDLGCGIGADAMAMAGLDLRVRAVDADEVTAAIAAVEPAPLAGVHRAPGPGRGLRACLPARALAASARGSTRPVARPASPTSPGAPNGSSASSAISPSWETVQEIARALPATGAKLSPAFPHAALPDGCEAQWTSYDGEVLECAVWWGPLVRTPGRTAALLGRGRAPLVVTERDMEGPAPSARQPGLPGAMALRARPRRAAGRARRRGDVGDGRPRAGLGRGLRQRPAPGGRALCPPVCRRRGDAVQRQGPRAAGFATTAWTA